MTVDTGHRDPRFTMWITRPNGLSTRQSHIERHRLSHRADPPRSQAFSMTAGTYFSISKIISGNYRSSRLRWAVRCPTCPTGHPLQENC